MCYAVAVAKMTTDLYHEQQSWRLCALHALNNLFQRENEFTQAELDQICYGLSPQAWVNPHKSVLGIGNYDVNVIMSALQTRGYEAKWFDKRRDISILNLDKIHGFILNVPRPYKALGLVPLPIKSKHWIALRWIPEHEAFFNLDSVLKSPQRIGEPDVFLNFLRDELASAEKELLVVVTSDAAGDDQWRHKVTAP